MNQQLEIFMKFIKRLSSLESRIKVVETKPSNTIINKIFNSVKNAEIVDNDLIISMLDGTQYNAGKIEPLPGKDGVGEKGEKGEKGNDGYGIDGKSVHLIRTENHIVWRHEDTDVLNHLISLEDLRGEDGIDGKDGKDGNHGRGIFHVEMNRDGDLLVEYTDGEKIRVGRIHMITGGMGIQFGAFSGVDPIHYNGTGGFSLLPLKAANFASPNISQWTNDAGYITSGSLGGYVPYIGATANIDLGIHTITAGNFIGPLTGNASTATVLAVGRTISITGDLTYTSPSFDGSGNVTAVGTLATVNSNVGSFGSSTSIPTIAVDGKGRITAVSENVVIAPAGTLTGTTLASGVITSSITTLGSDASLPGNPTTTTQSAGNNTTRIATTAFVTSAVSTAGATYVPYTGATSNLNLGVHAITGGTWNGDVVGLVYGGTNANLTPSNGGIFYSTASAAAILAGTATASKMLLSGATAPPTWSTSTIPSSAGATANKVLLSNGTNYILSTPTFPNASATSGKIIISDGTNWIASTPTYPATPGTIGKLLISDGTNWTSDSVNLAAGGVTGILGQGNGGTGFAPNFTDGQLLIGKTSDGSLQRATLTGTANQITVTNGAGTITLSLPQDIATTSTGVQLGAIGIGGSAASSAGINVNVTRGFGVWTRGAQTAVVALSFPSTLNYIVAQSETSTLTPGIGADVAAGTFCSPGIAAPIATTIGIAAGVMSKPRFDANVGIITTGYGFYFDGGIAETGTLTTGYGIRIAKPLFGTTKITAQFEGLTKFGTAQQSSFSDSGVLTLGTALSVGNGGSGTSTALTAGSVVTAGTSGIYTQDNADFFYDLTNHRLKIGSSTFAPASPLVVSGHSGVNNADITIDGLTSGASASITFTAAGTAQWQIGRGIGTGGGEFSIFDSVAGADSFVITTGGNITLGRNSSSQLTYNGIISATANTTGGGLTLPLLAATYLDVIVNGTHRKIPCYAN